MNHWSQVSLALQHLSVCCQNTCAKALLMEQDILGGCELCNHYEVGVSAAL